MDAVENLNHVSHQSSTLSSASNTDNKNESIEETEVTHRESQFESAELKICCRCSKITSHLFELDSCEHEVCVDCRFKDNIPCTFCISEDDEPNDSTVTLESSPAFSCIKKKKIINKDHIIDVKQDKAGCAKQMCTVCKRVFLKSNACYHYACATGVRPLVCTECDQTFVKRSHLNSHMNRHFGIKPFKCTLDNCKASFTQKDKLIRHMKSHNCERHTCEVCDKSYSSLAVLQFHLKRVHSTTKQYKCDLCPRMYKYNRTLAIHRLKHQAVKEHLCEVCGKKFSSAGHLSQHARSHIPSNHRPYICKRSVCKQRFTTRHDKARHELIHQAASSPDFECSLCNTTFGRKDNLERHMKNFHQVPLNLKKTVKKPTFVMPSKFSFNNKKVISINKNEKPSMQTLSNVDLHKESGDFNKKEKKIKNLNKQTIYYKNNETKKQLAPVSKIVKPLAIIHPNESVLKNHLNNTMTRPSVIRSVLTLQPVAIQQSSTNSNIVKNLTVNRNGSNRSVPT